MYPRLKLQRKELSLLFYTALSLLIMIGPGTSMGYSAVVLPVLTSNASLITLSTTEMPLFASLPIIFQIVGNLLGIITMKYGRCFAIMAINVTCSLGWILIASSYTVTQLFAGRVLTGIAGGLCGPTVAVYLSEISTSPWKEFLMIFVTVSFCSGIVVVYLLGCLIRNDWRFIATLCVIPPALSVICTVSFVPESPVWLLMKGREKAATIALLRIRGLRRETAEFREEFAGMTSCNELRDNREESQRSYRSGVFFTDETNVWSKLRNVLKTACLPEVWKPLMILIVYFLFLQFSGLQVIIAYAIDVITIAKITVDAFLVTVAVGIVQAVFGTISALCSTRMGRRTISIASGVGMSISLGVLGIYIQFFADIAGLVTLPLVCILVFTATGSFGFMVIPAAMMAELYPMEYVSVLAPITVFFNSLFNFAALQLYPTMVTQSENAIIYFYCAVCVIGTCFLIAVLPETRGKTKQQIKEEFRGDSRHIS